MEIIGTLIGIKATKSKANKDLFEGYLLVDPECASKLAHCKNENIVGKTCLVFKAWEPDATTFINVVMNEKLIDKKIKLTGSYINFKFECCLISKA